MDRPNTDICAHHIERTLREHGVIGHAGLVLREHHDKAKRRIVKLEGALRRAKQKLILYRAEHSGEYIGGTEYMNLMEIIDAALGE